MDDNPTHKRFSFRLLIAIGGLVIGIALGATERSDAHFTPWWESWPYSFQGDCWIENYVDPIGVAFTIEGWSNNLNFHAVEHGWWNNGGEPQNFYEHGCSGQSGQKSTDSDCCARYHFRWKEGAWWDQWWYWYSIATPHYDHSCGWHQGHATGYPDGFTWGKHHVHDTFAASGHHWFQESQYWDNRDWFYQSCADWWVGGNGFVWFIYVPWP
jgi:hypothetical protein